ncbi:hypothetical protein [Kribbella deserti]|uniref:Peptidase MA superfamily protein n=1 Tax=Kribbella deserti TaxID=1926257 RepID=A0ABV6QJR3_9ACTN
MTEVIDEQDGPDKARPSPAGSGSVTPNPRLADPKNLEPKHPDHARPNHERPQHGAAQHAAGAHQPEHAQPRTAGQLSRRAVLGLAVGLAASAGYLGIRQIGDDPNTGTAGPTPSSTPSTPDEAAEGVRRASLGGAVLQQLADAVGNGDRAGFLAAVDPRSTGFRDEARTVYNNLRDLPLAVFRMRYVSDDPGAIEPDRLQALGATEAWLAQVEVTWQLKDFDAKPARAILPVTMVARGSETYAASFSERFVSGQRRPIWALGELHLLDGDHSLVVSLHQNADLKAYTKLVDQAVDSVTEVWGRKWRRKTVLYLPAKQNQMEQLLGAQPNTYGQIAAVTMAELDQPQPNAPVRVVANPKLFGELGRQGRRIVLTHETTHIASNATASPVPLWLAEGFADYVAFTAVDVRTDSAAAELFKAVRAGKGPKGLPAPEMFAASSAELPIAYESSWLACRLIAETEGQAKLVQFYRAVHASKGQDGIVKAFRDVLGTTEQEFVQDWQRYLQRLAGA